MPGKTVQISTELLYNLFKYFLLNDQNAETESAIRKALETKYEAIVKRTLYGQSQTAETPEQREKARQMYLDMADISKDFRWSADYEERRKKHE